MESRPSTKSPPRVNLPANMSRIAAVRGGPGRYSRNFDSWSRPSRRPPAKPPSKTLDKEPRSANHGTDPVGFGGHCGGGDSVQQTGPLPLYQLSHGRICQRLVAQEDLKNFHNRFQMPHVIRSSRSTQVPRSLVFANQGIAHKSPLPFNGKPQGEVMILQQPEILVEATDSLKNLPPDRDDLIE